MRALHTYSSAKHLITPADLTACRLPRPAARPPQPSDSGAGSADFSALLAPDCRPGAGWVWSLRRLNALLNRVVLCEAVTAITDLLMEDGPSKDNFLRSEWRGVRGRGGGMSRSRRSRSRSRGCLMSVLCCLAYVYAGCTLY